MDITFFIKTYGCQANFADSEGLAKCLSDLGCKQVETEQKADLIIINTCAIREKAEQKIYSYLGKLTVLTKQKPYLKIGIIGCVASYKKKELYEKFNHISFAHGAREEISILQGYLTDLINQIQTLKLIFLQNPKSRSEICKQNRTLAKKILLNKHPSIGKNSISKLNLSTHVKTVKSNFIEKSPRVRSLINIMTGCNKYCSYCIVPFTRGREISYPMSDILTAIKNEIILGVKEINLLGQNVNSYIDPQTNTNFPELLKKIALIDGDFWVRFVSPHPQDMTKDLFKIMALHRPKLTAFLHFPLQSGSNKILKTMNRNYTSEEFLEKINWARRLIPNLTITTDIIVGFPGETKEDYLETLEIMEKVKFDQIYSFIYSKRKYTKAYNLEDNCPLQEKMHRLNILQNRQKEISLEKNCKNIGKILNVLVEKQLENGTLLSRTEGNTRVLLKGDKSLIGRFLKVKINCANVVNLQGEPIFE